MVSKQIKYGSMISYLLIILNMAMGLLYTPWILRVVGSSSYGLYTLAVSLIALFLTDFGMSAAVTRFIAGYRASDNQKGVNAFLGLAVKFYIMLCFFIAVVLMVVYCNIDIIYQNLTTDELSKFKVVFIIVAFFVVLCFPVNICNGILNAYEQYIYQKSADILNKLGTVVITIIALICNGGIYALIFINGLFNLFTFILKIILVKKKTPVSISFEKCKDVVFKDIFSFSLWTTIQTLANQMIFNLIPSVLAMVTNTMAITLYGFANVIEGYVFNITQAINGMFLPSVSRLVVKEKNASSTLPLMIKVGRVNQSIVSLLLIGLILVGKDFVRLWVGNEYSDLYYCILALCLPYSISASQQIGNTSITVMNKVKYSAFINLFTGLINLVISYFVAGRYGVIGVCATIGIIFWIRIISLNVVYYYVLKINIFKFFKECQLKMLPSILISGGVAYEILKFINNSYSGVKGWLILGVKGTIITIVYIGVMWLWGWNSSEKKLFSSFFSKIISK